MLARVTAKNVDWRTCSETVYDELTDTVDIIHRPRFSTAGKSCLPSCNSL